MNEKDEIRDSGSFWREPGRSPGFWIFLFSSFGLLSLSIGEDRIQKRMLRYQYQLENQRAALEAARQSGTVASDEPSKNRQFDSANSPYQYQLAGLRWILGLAAIAGVAIMVFNARSRHLVSSRSRDTLSL